MQRRRLVGCGALGLLLAGTARHAAGETPAGLRAPNVVEISAQLTTSGQPSAESLAALKAQGFGAVVYLAPPTVIDAVRDEPLIVGRQGLVYVNLPVPFDEPTAQHLDTFIAALRALEGRKVLVHCQINMRASVFVFLYRVIALREEPQRAYEAVARVWTPRGPWRRLIQDQLRARRIDFDPF